MKLFKKNAPKKVEIPKESLWRSMYKNGGRLNLPSAISAEMARLVTLEMSSRIYGSKRADIMDNFYRKLISQSRSFCEVACAIGGVILKPYISNGQIETAIVPQDSFKIKKTFPDGTISWAEFYEYIKEGNKKYLKIEEHIRFSESYLIRNKAYLVQSSTFCEVSLSEVSQWSDFESEVVLEGVKVPLFAYFKMPFVSREDITSPVGEPIFARSCDLIEDAEKQYERLLWEFESGERALYVDETAVRRGKNGEAEFPDKKLYRTLATGNDELFCDWTPEIRDEAIINGLEKILKRIEFNSGLAYGTLSDPQCVEKTAEEIRASKQRSYATVTEIQISLKNALTEWAKAVDILCSLYELAQEGEYRIDFLFDDSIVADRVREFEERLALLKEGVITADEMKSWYLGKGERD